MCAIAASNLIGWMAPILIGLMLAPLLAWATARKAGKAWEGLVKNRSKNGDFYWVDANVTAIKEQAPDPTLVAILQLDTLSKFAASENTKLIIPAESSALLGAAQALRSVMADVPGMSTPPAAAS